MADLYLMCGVPGCGKSTFLKNKINKDNSIIVSRDEIRFSLLKPYEQYFAHEKEVLEILWMRINEGLANGKDVFVDQTSLTAKSRKWLLEHVHGYEHANLVWIDEELETCLERNEKRRGTKAYVPRESVVRMYSQFVMPSLNEGFYRIYHYSSKENKMTYKGAAF